MKFDLFGIQRRKIERAENLNTLNNLVNVVKESNLPEYNSLLGIKVIFRPVLVNSKLYLTKDGLTVEDDHRIYTRSHGGHASNCSKYDFKYTTKPSLDIIKKYDLSELLSNMRYDLNQYYSD
jgi:hypothetical protein